MSVELLRGPELLVDEFSGDPRSGKGSEVAYIAHRHAGVATEETGADYRATTFGLVVSGVIEPGMPEAVVQSAVERVGLTKLTDFTASRNELVAEHGTDCLYEPRINELVAHVSPVAAVRKAVKAGFKERVQRVIQNGQHDVLLVDGRNLAPVIAEIPGARLMRRTYVACSTREAARREALRQGVSRFTPEYEKIERTIAERKAADANRKIDPVRPEPDAIDYWHDNTVSYVTHKHIADSLYRGDMAAMISERRNQGAADLWLFLNMARYGAGRLAVEQGRQILFDTTKFYTTPYHESSLQNSLIAANIIFEEALETARNQRVA